MLTGAIGFMWLAFWLPMYPARSTIPVCRGRARVHPERSPRIRRERLLGPSDPAPQASAFAIASMTDPIWWFYLFWTPNFLRDVHKLDLSTIPLPLIVVI